MAAWCYRWNILYAGQDIDWNLEHLLLGVGNLMKSNKIDAIIALDDYDVEKQLIWEKIFASMEWGKLLVATLEIN
jgi:hypothetical protein